MPVIPVTTAANQTTAPATTNPGHQSQTTFKVTGASSQESASTSGGLSQDDLQLAFTKAKLDGPQAAPTKSLTEQLRQTGKKLKMEMEQSKTTPGTDTRTTDAWLRSASEPSTSSAGSSKPTTSSMGSLMQRQVRHRRDADSESSTSTTRDSSSTSTSAPSTTSGSVRFSSRTSTSSASSISAPATTPSPIEEKVDKLEGELKQTLSHVPKNANATNPILKKAMEEHKQLAQLHLQALNELAPDGVQNIAEGNVSQAFHHAEMALLHNSGNRTVNHETHQALRQFVRHHRNDTSVGIDRVRALKHTSSEAFYQKNVALQNSTAAQLWDTGNTSSVNVGGVETMYHYMPNNNWVNSRLVMIYPGRSEPMEMYREMTMELNRGGNDVLIVGFPGNGDTGTAGHIDDFTDYTGGVDYIMRNRNELLDHQYDNVTIIGHSTGGLVATRQLQNDTHVGVDQLYLVSPMFDINVSTPQRAALSFADTVLSTVSGWANSVAGAFGYDPQFQFDAVYVANRDSYYTNENTYTQSQERYNRLVEVRNNHTTMPPTISWVNSAIQAAGQAVTDASTLNIPGINTTVFMAGADSTVRNEVTQRFIDGANATGIMVNGSLHTMLQEADPYRMQVVTTILEGIGRPNNGTDSATGQD